MTKLARTMLWLSALLFAAFGAFLLIDPGGMEKLGLPLAVPRWRTEIRAFYGGLELGLAAFLALCTRREEWAVPGLAAAAFILGGAGTGRLLGIALDGTDQGMVIAMATELGGALAAGIAAHHEARAARSLR